MVAKPMSIMLWCNLTSSCQAISPASAVQEYVYKFNYNNDGGVTVDLTTNGKPVDHGKKKKKPVSVL